MPKLPAFEDWRWPWKAGELDEDKAAKLIYNLKLDVEKGQEKLETQTVVMTETQGKLDEAVADLAAKGDKADRSDIEKDLQRQVRELTTAASKTDPKAQAQIDRLTVALTLGLSLADANRLVGETLEELKADAEVFAKDHGIELLGEGMEDDSQEPPSRAVRSASSFRTGNQGAGDGQVYETDPSKVVLPSFR